MVDLSTFDAVFLDLDGTIWHEDTPLEGSVELIQRLQTCSQKHAFLSNSGFSPRLVLKRFEQFGLTVDPQFIHTAAKAACDYVVETFGAGGRVYNVGNESVNELLQGRVTLVEDENDPVDVVMVSTLVHSSAKRLQAATRLLLKGAKLVGLCADRNYPTTHGIQIGAGAVTSMLAYAAQVTPVYCGKPEAWFFLDLCRRLNVEPWRCVLIGDNLEADIAGARRVGMKSILTLTGVSTRQHHEAATADQRADWVIGTLSDLKFR